MADEARGLLDRVREGLPADGGGSRLVSRIAEGVASLPVIAALAAEESHIVASDRRSFLILAARASQSVVGDFFTSVAEGEKEALSRVPAMAAAAGMDAAGLAAYEPRAGCQAYPAFVAWLALNAEPAEVVLAMSANFAVWGAYCATMADALRREYGFTDQACGFVDFFATPAPQLEQQALAAVQAALTAGAPLANADRYARLLHSYELMFWNTLADTAEP